MTFKCIDFVHILHIFVHIFFHVVLQGEDTDEGRGGDGCNGSNGDGLLSITQVSRTVGAGHNSWGGSNVINKVKDELTKNQILYLSSIGVCCHGAQTVLKYSTENRPVTEGK